MPSKITKQNNSLYLFSSKTRGYNTNSGLLNEPKLQSIAPKVTATLQKLAIEVHSYVIPICLPPFCICLVSYLVKVLRYCTLYNEKIHHVPFFDREKEDDLRYLVFHTAQSLYVFIWESIG